MPLPHKAYIFLLLVLLCCQSFAQNSKENADFKLAINLYNDGLYDLAAEQLKQFIGAYGNTSQGIDARYYLGLAQMKLKQFDDARLTFQTFALTYQDNPKAPEAWANVGESYAAVKSYKEAALAFERVKVFHPKSKTAPDALLQASKYFSLAGEQSDARRVLRAIIQEYPASGATLSARTQLGRLYFEEGNLDQAQNELKRVIDGDPSADAKSQALLILGNMYQATGRNDLAQSNYQDIITKYKSTSATQGANLGMGKLLTGAGKYSEGIEYFKKITSEKSPTDSSLLRQALVDAGDAYAALKEYSNAVSLYNRFFSTFPGDTLLPEVLWKSAAINNSAANYKRSNELCLQILKSNAKDILKRRAQLQLALNAQAQKNMLQAVQLYGSFLDQHPDDPAAGQIAFRIAGLLEKYAQDLRKASLYYEILMNRYPHSPLVDDAVIADARCYEQLKEFDRATHLYRDLADQYPASEFRSQAEERITTIKTFEAKEKNAGLEKLALLLGDMVGEKDKTGLAFRLGEIYFNDLKNYAAAAAQFSNAINSGMNDSRFVDALYMRAQSYEYLSRKDETNRAKAIEAFEIFLKAYPNDDRSEDAIRMVFDLRATTLAAAQAAYATTLSVYPGFRQSDAMLLRIGILQQDGLMLDSALGTFSALYNSSSSSAEEAGFRKIEILKAMETSDSVVAVGQGYLAKFPRGRYTARVLDLVAGILLETGDARRAAVLYEKLNDEFSYTSFAEASHQRLAEAYLADKNYDRAIDFLTDLVDNESNNSLPEADVNPSFLFSLGKAHHAAGNSAKAKKYLLQFVAQERAGEQTGEAYNILGMISRSEGALDQATSYFRQAGIASPASAASGDIAQLLFDGGNYPDAIRQFTQLAQSAKNDSERQSYDAKIIVAQLRNEELPKAEQEIASFAKQYRATTEDLATFELEKGSYYYRKTEYTNARKSFDLVAKKYDETKAAPFALYWTGKVLESTDKPQDALKIYERLMQDYPNSAILPRVYVALGNIYYGVEKWDESVKYYKRVVDDTNADPSLLPFAMSNLIETYETAGLFDAALTLTRKYLELYPNNEDSFDKKIKIGILYQRLGYNDQSVLHLQSLLDEAGSDLEGEIRYYIAEANYNKGDYQQAILDFLKVPYLVTKKGKLDWTANSLYMSGQSYEKMGRYDQALTMYQQIIDRRGIDETFKAAAKKEMDRVKLVLKRSSN